MFEEQLAGLKALNEGKDRTIEALTAQVAEMDARLRRVGTGHAPSAVASRAPAERAEKKKLSGQYTPHGANCQCIGCRHLRADSERQREYESA